MRDIFKYKDLIFQLAFRDLKLLYRRPFLGFLWMLVIPLTTAIIYKILFSDFMHASSGKYPFFIHLLTALLPWNYFAASVSQSSTRILASKKIIGQMSFPKYLLPLSTVLVNLIIFLPTLIVLMGSLIAFKVSLSAWIVFLPAVVLIQTCLIIGVSFIVSSLQVIYRDTEYFIQIFITALFFLTPGVYTLSDLTGRANPILVKIYMLNPLVGILNLYRIVLIKGYWSDLPGEVNFLNTFVYPVLWAVFILFLGYYVFKKYEKSFFDHVYL